MRKAERTRLHLSPSSRLSFHGLVFSGCQEPKLRVACVQRRIATMTTTAPVSVVDLADPFSPLSSTGVHIWQLERWTMLSVQPWQITPESPT